MTRFRILIADDDLTQHEVLGDYLERSGFDVLHAYDGTQALEVAGREHIDLVCLDIRMPGKDGFQVLSSLQESSPDLPVLFLSSLDAAHVKVRGLELGAEDFIVKPFQKAEVLARVRAALRRSTKYRRLQETLSGDLSQMGLTEILQAMELGRKTVQVRIETGPGSITLKEGRLVSVRWKNLTGAPALQRLLLLNSGRFSIRFVDVDEEGTQPANGALMDALVAQDEALATLEELGDLEGKLELADDLSQRFIEFGPPLTLKTLLGALPGDLRDAATEIKNWYEKGLVRPVSPHEGAR